MRLIRYIPAAIASAVLVFSVSGCSTSFAPSAVSAAPVASATPIAGKLYGGQQAIAGANVYLFAAATSGYGAASVSLLQPYSCSPSSECFPTVQDPNGNYYVTTGSDGSFNLVAGEYACQPGQQVYLYSLGGNTGNGNNAAAGLLAILGQCQGDGSLPAPNSVIMNEVSTVAAAYAFAGFATDATHVANDAGDGQHNSAAAVLANTGMANAFVNAANLYTVSVGSEGALAVTPAGNGIVPQAELNTIADGLAACVNTTGASSGPCSNLFSNIHSNGTDTGDTATDTATLAIYIAHNSGLAGVVSAVFNNVANINPFNPVLTSQPRDLSVSIYYQNTGLSSPSQVAVDGGGDVFVMGQAMGSASSAEVAEFAPYGEQVLTYKVGGEGAEPKAVAIDVYGSAWVVTGDGALKKLQAPGLNQFSIVGGGLTNPGGLAFDPSGDMWAPNTGTNTVSEFSSTGVPLTAGGYIDANLAAPAAIVMDHSGVAWISDPSNGIVDRISNTGSVLSDYAANYTGGGYLGIALDASSSAWVVDNYGNCVLHLNAAGTTAANPSNCYTNARMYEPAAIAVDGLGNVWVANQGGDTLEEFDNSGDTLTSNGFTNSSMRGPSGLAIDGAGNVWMSDGDYSDGAALEFIGAAAPVVTPLSTGTLNGTYGTRP